MINLLLLLSKTKNKSKKEILSHPTLSLFGFLIIKILDYLLKKEEEKQKINNF